MANTAFDRTFNVFISQRQSSDNIKSFLYTYKNDLTADQYVKLCLFISDMKNIEDNNFNICVSEWKLLYIINPEDDISDEMKEVIMSNICDIIYSAIKIRCKNKLMNSIFNIAWEYIHEFNIDSLLLILNTCSKFKFDEYCVSKIEYYTRLKNVIFSHIHKFNNNQIISILESYAKLEFDRLEIDVSEIKDYIDFYDQRYNGYDYSRLIHSVAKLNICDPSWRINIPYYVDKYINKFRSHELSNVIWGLAKLTIDISSELKLKIKNKVGNKINEFVPKEISDIIWSFNVLKIPINPNGDLKEIIKKNACKFNSFQLRYSREACIGLGMNICDIPEFN